MKNFDVIGIGSVLVDNLAVLPAFPEADSKIEIIKNQKQLGGPVPTSLMTLSSLGIKTSFIGKIGDDENSGFISKTLENSGIDTSCLIKEPFSKSGYSQVWIDSKNNTRTIAYSSGTLSPINAWDIDVFPDGRLLHLDGRNHDIAQKAISLMKGKNTLISIDTGNFREKTLELIPSVDIAVMPRRFATEFVGGCEFYNLSEKMRKAFPQPKLIVITDGVNGSVCSYQDRIYTQKAFEIEAFDTTGAGDVHCAGIIYGVLQNWNIEKILKFAAAMAAVKCRHLGNKTLPNKNEVANLISSYSLVG